MFITIEANEITTPGLLRAEGSSFVSIRVSHSQNVAAAEDRPFKCRVRMLESHMPNPDPLTVTHEAPVATDAGGTLLKTMCTGTNTIETFKLATALFPMVTAIFRMPPSDGI